jgi:hypothetical protein
MKARIFNHGSQRSSSEKDIGIHTVKLMVQCLPVRLGKLERLLCTCRSNSPDMAFPRNLLEPVYCETRSVHCPGKMTIGTILRERLLKAVLGEAWMFKS